ncbi:MAG: zinc ribbon domain-containing protein [Nitrospirae bacterium]|nr:zinc ribbon domain-containing protein [Nitrospirota bacterium]
MPLYEYECESCGGRTEVLQRIGAPPIGTCEVCGGKMKRLLSAPAFQFKGTGWYVTDYAKKSSAPEGESQGGTESSKSEPKKSADGKSGSKEKTSSESSKKKGPASD